MINRRGFVLFIVLSVIGILAYLSLEMVTSALTSRRLSLHGVWSTKARLVARSGLERGIEGSVGRLLSSTAPAFTEFLWSSGDDRNRNGTKEAWETVSGSTFSIVVPIEMDHTPSFALEDPTIPGRSLLLETDGVIHGVSLMADGGSLIALIQMSQPGLYLNGGVLAGEGAEGARFASRYGMAYTAHSLSHPFNRPMVNMLNAWGNYHKYMAMVRSTKTYNYTVGIDHTANLGTTSAGATNYRNPWGLFDRFDPSGNHVIPGVVSEMPLGDRLLTNRPAQGYKSLERPLEILAEYVASWTDKFGAWKYADGNDIPALTESQLTAIKQEFIRLAVVHHHGDYDDIYFPEPDIGDVIVGDPTDPTPFENEVTRRYLCQGVFKVDSMRTNFNTAPESLLAATLYAPRGVRMMRYQPLDNLKLFAMDANPCQSENNHPCAYTYNLLHPRIAGAPLYSMTESVRLARDLMALRLQAPGYYSLATIRSNLQSWSRGYDSKQSDACQLYRFSSTQPSPILKNAERYYDVEFQNFRGSILFQLLNPNANLSSLVWDEALPGRIDNAVMSMTNQEWLHRNPKYTYMFDKFMPHERGNTLECISGVFRITSLGYWREGNKSLAHAKLTCDVWPYEVARISTQREFERVAVHPTTGVSSLGQEWVSYPETMGLVTDYDGQLALKPTLQICPMGQGAPTLRCTLSGYEANPTQTQPAGYWPRGDRLLMGPDENPARGKLLNSLNPAPGAPVTSLLPPGPDQIDAANDLMPGGGIRMSPWHNSPGRDVDSDGISFFNRREALLVLRNARVQDTDDANYPSKTHVPALSVPKAIPNTLEGAVSFYFKPRFGPNRLPYMPTPGILPTADVTSDGGQTLFYTNFVIEDEEVKTRFIKLGTSLDHRPSQYYHMHIRLAWGSSPAQSYKPPPSPVPTYSYMFTYLPYVWPYVQPFYIGPNPGDVESHQSGTDSSLFDDMYGYYLPPIYIPGGFFVSSVSPKPFLSSMFSSAINPNGDGIQGHFGAPNSFCWEQVVLEIIFSKFADMNPDHCLTSNVNRQLMNSFYPTWDSGDLPSPVAERFSYPVSDSNGLYIMETMTPDNLDKNIAYHTVRKAFYLSHPYDLDWTSAGVGFGPMDSRKNHQLLIQPGRWNHIFLAWRNMWDLLNVGSSHKGGSLAAYVNGSFRKLSTAKHGTTAFFIFQDHSTAFPSTVYPGVMPHTDVGEYDNYTIYNYPNAFADRVYTFPNYEAPFNGPIFYYTPNYFTGKANYLPGPLWIAQLMDYGYCNPAQQHMDVRKTDIFERFPPRLYFGFEPTSQCFPHLDMNEGTRPYHPSFTTWGSFMDIQVFPRAADALLSPDMGFRGNPTVPGYDSFSVYPNNTQSFPTRLYPTQHDKTLKKILGVTWSAYLPEFHNYYDDQTLPVGPDPSDAQLLTLTVTQSGLPLGVLRVSQLPASVTPPIYHHKFTGGLGVGVPASLSFDLAFRGPTKVNSTPLVDDITIIHQRQQSRYMNFNWE